MLRVPFRFRKKPLRVPALLGAGGSKDKKKEDLAEDKGRRGRDRQKQRETKRGIGKTSRSRNQKHTEWESEAKREENGMGNGV